jgi:hypothetical protein
MFESANFKKKWKSDNGKWSITVVEKGQNSAYLNIHEKIHVMLSHIHMVRVEFNQETITIFLQNNNNSKRIPKYVKQKAMELCV